MTSFGPLDDMPTGDEIVVPVNPDQVSAVIIAMGGKLTAAHTWQLPGVAEPQQPLPLRLGDIDLGRWRLAHLQARARHSSERYTLTLQRVATAGEL